MLLRVIELNLSSTLRSDDFRTPEMTIRFHAGSAARAQAPAPSHASAILATPELQGVASGASYGLPTLESQIASSSIFGALKCRDALGAVYNAYKLSGDWSQVSTCAAEIDC